MNATVTNDAGAAGVLLLGNYRPTLTLARVLSDSGYRVISGREGCDGGAEHCRFVDEIWDHRSVKTDGEAFLADLEAFLARRPDISIVYPVSEEFIRLLSGRRSPQADGPTYVIASPETVAMCLDKVRLMSIALENDVPTALFEMVSGAADVRAAAERIGLPIVVRPEKSTDRIGGKKAIVCETAEQVSDIAEEVASANRKLLLQRKVSGPRHNIYFGAQDGRIVRYLHALVLRTDMLDGTGLAVDGITIEPDPVLRRHTERLISALNYTGIGCAQFLVDDRGSGVSFLEINPRIAGNHAVPEHAGLGLSQLAIDLVVEPTKSVPMINGRPGLRYVWTCGDLLGTKHAYLRGEIGGLTATLAICRTLGTALFADIHMNWSWRDPMPGLHALGEVMPSWRGVATRALRAMKPRWPSWQRT